MKDERVLEKEALKTLYPRMVIPTVAAQLVNLAYSIIDRIYIGHIPNNGNISLAGVGICLPILIIVSAFAQLGGVGGAAKFSLYLGADNKENAKKVLSGSFLFLMMSGLLMTILVRFYSAKILMLFGASAETLPYATDYLNIYLIGTVFVEIATGMVCFVTAEGFAHISLISVLLGAGLNMLLDPLFIFYFSMDVRGAAIATVISQAVSAIFVIWFLRGKRTTIQLQIKDMFSVRWDILLNSLALGLSPFVMQVTESVVNICYNRSLVQYGGVKALGAMTVCSSIMSMVIYPLMGIGQGVQPIIGFNYGAGNIERVKKTCFASLGNGLVYSAVIWGMLRLFPTGFVSLFSADLTFTSYAVSKSGTYFLMLWVMGIQVVTQNLFLALGNAGLSLFLAFFRKVILLVPLIYVMPGLVSDQVEGVFLAEPIADTIAAFVTIALFILRYQKVLLKKTFKTD